MNPAPCIHIQNLRVTHTRHDGHKAPLVHVPDLSIAGGLVTAILGPSGSGKSTLLRAINRLNECWPDLRTEGQVTLFLEGYYWPVYPEEIRDARPACTSACPPVSPHSYPLDRLRRKAGMVFQHPHILPLSIARNMTLPLMEGAGFSREQAQERMETALQQAGLWHEVKDRLNTMADRLSGGQMQRLCLARALALEPEILLLDEPTASLDAKAADQVEQTIHEMRGRLSIVLVTHSVKQAARLAGAQVHMRDGQIVQSAI